MVRFERALAPTNFELGRDELLPPCHAWDPVWPGHDAKILMGQAIFMAVTNCGMATFKFVQEEERDGCRLYKHVHGAFKSVLLREVRQPPVMQLKVCAPVAQVTYAMSGGEVCTLEYYGRGPPTFGQAQSHNRLRLHWKGGACLHQQPK